MAGTCDVYVRRGLDPHPTDRADIALVVTQNKLISVSLLQQGGCSGETLTLTRELGVYLLPKVLFHSPHFVSHCEENN